MKLDLGSPAVGLCFVWKFAALFRLNRVTVVCTCASDKEKDLSEFAIRFKNDQSSYFEECKERTCVVDLRSGAECETSNDVPRGESSDLECGRW